MRYIIEGAPRTKKNHMQIRGSGARCPMCGKPQKQWVSQGEAYQTYAEAALWQLKPPPPEPISTAVNVKCVYYMPTRQSVDLLNLLGATLDLLVAARVLIDDSCKFAASHDGSRVKYDPKRPRVEKEITEATNDEK